MYCENDNLLAQVLVAVREINFRTCNLACKIYLNFACFSNS